MSRAASWWKRGGRTRWGSEMHQFTKIKWKPGEKLELQWVESVGEGKTAIVHQLASVEEPAAALPECLQAFVPEVLKLLRLPATYADDMSVTALTINYEDDDRMGLVVTCLKQLSSTNAPLVLNTPHLREADNDAVGHFLPARMVQLLEDAKVVAERFLLGERAQLSLIGVGEVALKAARDIRHSLDEGESVTVSLPGHAPVTLHGRPKPVQS